MASKLSSRSISQSVWLSHNGLNWPLVFRLCFCVCFLVLGFVFFCGFALFVCFRCYGTAHRTAYRSTIALFWGYLTETAVRCDLLLIQIFAMNKRVKRPGGSHEGVGRKKQSTRVNLETLDRVSSSAISSTTRGKLSGFVKLS